MRKLKKTKLRTLFIEALREEKQIEENGSDDIKKMAEDDRIFTIISLVGLVILFGGLVYVFWPVSAQIWANWDFERALKRQLSPAYKYCIERLITNRELLRNLERADMEVYIDWTPEFKEELDNCVRSYK